MASPTLDRETILQAVRALPADEQWLLAQEILLQIGAPLVEEPQTSPDSQGLAGLLATDQTPPADDEIAQWLSEHRMEKYGR